MLKKSNILGLDFDSENWSVDENRDYMETFLCYCVLDNLEMAKYHFSQWHLYGYPACDILICESFFLCCKLNNLKVAKWLYDLAKILIPLNEYFEDNDKYYDDDNKYYDDGDGNEDDDKNNYKKAFIITKAYEDDKIIDDKTYLKNANIYKLKYVMKQFLISEYDEFYEYDDKGLFLREKNNDEKNKHYERIKNLILTPNYIKFVYNSVKNDIDDENKNMIEWLESLIEIKTTED